MIAISIVVGCGQPPADRAATDAADSASSAREPFDWRQRIGVAQLRADSSCLRIRDPNLQPGTGLVLIPHDTTAERAVASVLARLETCPLMPPDDEYLAYSVSSERGQPGYYFAVSHLTAADPLDLDRDGELERFHVCNSVEGLHFTVWARPSVSETPIWRYYHYVGYDMEPTCTNRDYGLPDTAGVAKPAGR